MTNLEIVQRMYDAFGTAARTRQLAETIRHAR